jgi:hypothetical protein
MRIRTLETKTVDKLFKLKYTITKEDAMKRTNMIFNTLAVLLATATCAFAGEPVKVYSSSMLVLAFVGFLALIVVIQLVPAIMTLIGAITGLAKKREETEVAKVGLGE